MDSSVIDKAGDFANKAVCELSQVQYSRDSPWPFIFSVPSRNIVINRVSLAKKSEKKEIGEHCD